MNPHFALIDCNNFYAACERLFDPSLANRPVVVLSNNDGCVVARCPRARALGIPMGMPAFKIRECARQHNIAFRSSNYELYGDVSRRVMQVLTRFSPEIEIYSIDEAFLAIDNRTLQSDPALGQRIRATLLRWLGMPVGVGIGPTKTLAKAANWKAKQTPDGTWTLNTESECRALLAEMPVGKVWGIGPRRSRQLAAEGIHTAADFVAHFNARRVQRDFTVTGLRTWRELCGIPCLAWAQNPPDKQSICTSRSFGRAQTSLTGVQAAVAAFAAACAEKLRRQALTAPIMQVFLATDRFRDNQPQHTPIGLWTFPQPVNDTLEMTSAACTLVHRLFRPGHAYKKAGVIVAGLLPTAIVQGNLFTQHDHRAPQRQALMQSIDAVNRRFGRETITTGAVLAASSTGWEMRQMVRSPRYTTRWDEIMQIHAACTPSRQPPDAR